MLPWPFHFLSIIQHLPVKPVLLPPRTPDARHLPKETSTLTQVSNPFSMPYKPICWVLLEKKHITVWNGAIWNLWSLSSLGLHVAWQPFNGIFTSNRCHVPLFRAFSTLPQAWCLCLLPCLKWKWNGCSVSIIFRKRFSHDGVTMNWSPGFLYTDQLELLPQ